MDELVVLQGVSFGAGFVGERYVAGEFRFDRSQTFRVIVQNVHLAFLLASIQKRQAARNAKYFWTGIVLGVLQSVLVVVPRLRLWSATPPHHTTLLRWGQ